jgi:hypothetical protein
LNAVLGCVIVVVDETLQPLASVAITVYVFAKRVLNKPVALDMFPGFTKNVTGLVPPTALALIIPLAVLKHGAFVFENVFQLNGRGCVIRAVVVFEHPFASVAVIVYVLGNNPIKVPVVLDIFPGVVT